MLKKGECRAPILPAAPIEGLRGARGESGTLRHRVSSASAAGHACAPHLLGTVASPRLFLAEAGRMSRVFSQQGCGARCPTNPARATVVAAANLRSLVVICASLRIPPLRCGTAGNGRSPIEPGERPPDTRPPSSAWSGMSFSLASGVGRPLRYRFVPDGVQRRNSPLEPSFRRCLRCPSSRRDPFFPLRVETLSRFSGASRNGKPRKEETYGVTLLSGYDQISPKFGHRRGDAPVANDTRHVATQTPLRAFYGQF